MSPRIISPDGRWLAYEADDSGRTEVYVRPFPEVNSGHWQVSTTGGTRPLWAPSGLEVFYVAPTGAIMRVGVERGLSWAAPPPTLLIKEGYYMSAGGNSGRRTGGGWRTSPGRSEIYVRPAVCSAFA